MSLTYPLVLFGFFAILIPIAIHLFDLQKPKKIYFSNVAMLQNIVSQTKSSRKLKHWLLLILRCLTFIFIILAFAQPYISKLNHNQASKQTINSVFIDNSISMSRPIGQLTLFDEAIHQAEILLNKSDVSARYLLSNCQKNAKDETAISSKKIKDLLTEQKIGDYVANSDQILNRTRSSIDANGLFDQKNMYWFSDFQKSNFNDLSKIKLNPDENLFLVPIQSTESNNIYVDSVWLEQPFVKAGENCRFFVKINQVGKSDNTRNINLKFDVNGSLSATQIISFNNEKTKTVSFQFVPNNESFQECKISLDDEETDYDNEFYFTIKPSDQINVFIIRDDNNLNKILNAYQQESLFKVEQNQSQNVSSKLLNNSSLTIIDGIDKPSEFISKNIKDNLKKGAYCLIFPPIKQQNWTSWLQIDFGINVQSISYDIKPLTKVDELANIDFKNPFFNTIFESVDQNITLPYSFPQYELKNSSDKILVHKSGSPFLASYQYGKGRIFIASTPLNDQYTNIQNHSLFVPILYKIAFGSLNAEQNLSSTIGSQEVILPYNSIFDPEIAVEVKSKENDFLLNASIIDNKISIDISSINLKAGFYSVSQNNQFLGKFSLNQNNLESEIECFSENELTKIFENNKQIKVVKPNILNQILENQFSLNTENNWWKYLLFAAILCLLAEIILVRYINHQA